MSFPIGVNTVTLTIGTTLAGDGESGSFDGAVVPIFGGTVRAILWLGDGTAYTDVSGTVVSGPSGVAAVAVPDPHQDGWVVPTLGPGGATVNVPITDWGYFVSGIITFASGKNRIIGKAVKITPGQTAVDLDTVADGQLVGGIQGPYVPAGGGVGGPVAWADVTGKPDLTGMVRSVLVTTGNEARPSADLVIWVSPDSITPVNAAATDLVATPTGTADASAPTVPTGLTVTGQTTTTLDVSWGASTDNVGVTGYEVRLNSGTGVTKAVSPRTHQFTGLTPATTYAVQVRARDAAGNWSAWCTAVNGTTASAGGSAQHSIYGGASPGTASVQSEQGTMRVASSFYRLNSPTSTAGWRVIGGRLYIPAGSVGSLPSTVTIRLYSTPYGTPIDFATATPIQTKVAAVAAGWITALFDAPYSPAVGGTERIWIEYTFGTAQYISIDGSPPSSIPASDGSPLKFADAGEASMGRSRYRSGVTVGQSDNPFGLDSLWDEG